MVTAVTIACDAFLPNCIHHQPPDESDDHQGQQSSRDEEHKFTGGSRHDVFLPRNHRGGEIRGSPHSSSVSSGASGTSKSRFVTVATVTNLDFEVPEAPEETEDE